ncbi:M28 family peptidase [Modestobacter sp. I12A-02662]|uniref:M28 family peptidase n=1 Tax=Modestobacter sp. I12A-02662 TaxID=1730496 RepID=UPI0034DF6223
MIISDDPAPEILGEPSPATRTWVGVAGLAVLLLVAVVSVLALLPAAPREAGAPPGEFSAARALDQLGEVATAPRPVGSAEHARVRGHLLAVLGDLGWRTEVHEGVGVTDFGEAGTVPVAVVRNVVATLPGTDHTGTVLLAAHYDTVAGSPGAGDDGLGMGVLLEVARALTAADAPRNDVVLLFTDAEEAGLLGAEAFARDRSSALGPTVVLNHEARGARGAPMTFRTTSPNGPLLEALARAPGAQAESLSEAVFEALPNGSDFTHFAAAGMHVLDTAIAAGGAHYHSPVDDLEHLSAASLQQMGEDSLAVTGQFAAADLTAVTDGDEQIVTTLPWGLLRYPQDLEVPLALAPLVLAAALVALRRRRRALPLPRTALGGVVAVLALAAAGLAGWGVWQAALAVDPGQASAVVGEPYHPVPYQVAVLLAAAGAVLAVVGLARRRLGVDALAVGAIAVLALAGTVVGLTLPGVSGVLVLPVLCAVAGAVTADLLPRRWAGARVAVVLCASAAVTLLLGPGAWLGFDIGLSLGGPSSAVLVGLLVLLVLPVVDLAWPAPTATGRRGAGRAAAVPVVALALAVVLTGAGLVTNREGATPPRQEQVSYSLDADIGQALWTSWRRPPSAWSASLLTEPPAPADDLPHADSEVLARGPAPVIDLPPPEVTVISDGPGRDGRRELVLRLSSPRGAPAVGLWVDTGTAAVHEVSVAGQRLPTNGPWGRWDFGFTLEGTPPEGTEVRLLLEQRAEAVALHVGDRSDSLSVPGATPPRERLLVVPELWVTRGLTL